MGGRRAADGGEQAVVLGVEDEVARLDGQGRRSAVGVTRGSVGRGQIAVADVAGLGPGIRVCAAVEGAEDVEPVAATAEHDEQPSPRHPAEP